MIVLGDSVTLLGEAGGFWAACLRLYRVQCSRIAPQYHKGSSQTADSCEYSGHSNSGALEQVWVCHITSHRVISDSLAMR